MYRFFVDEKDKDFLIKDKIDIDHARKVLRLKENEKVEVCYNSEEYISKVKKISKDIIILEEIEKVNINRETSYNIKVYQGIPKLKKIEIIAQNITQAGAKELFPVVFERSVKTDIKENQIDRVRKIIKESAMQSKRLMIPTFYDIIDFDNLIEELYSNTINIVFYEEERTHTIKNVLKKIKENNIEKIGVIIGPEGGFEEEEIEKLKSLNVECVTLGNRIFRTEIAASSAINMINYELEIEDI